MQGHLPSHGRIEQVPFNAALILNPMPHPCEKVNRGIPDQGAAIRQGNEDVANISRREVDIAMRLVRAFAL